MVDIFKYFIIHLNSERATYLLIVTSVVAGTPRGSSLCCRRRWTAWIALSGSAFEPMPSTSLTTAGADKVSLLTIIDANPGAAGERKVSLLTKINSRFNRFRLDGKI